MPSVQLSVIDSATWLALRACCIQITREELCRRRYDDGNYVPRLQPNEICATHELLAYAKETLVRANDRRKAIDEKVKLLSGLVTFFIPISLTLSARLGPYSFTMVAPLACFGVALMLLLSYFRLGMMAQPIIGPADGRLEADALRAVLISDHLRAADRNEKSTSFQADVFRAGTRSFIVGVLVLVISITLLGQ